MIVLLHLPNVRMEQSLGGMTLCLVLEEMIAAVVGHGGRQSLLIILREICRLNTVILVQVRILNTTKRTHQASMLVMIRQMGSRGLIQSKVNRDAACLLLWNMNQ